MSSIYGGVSIIYTPVIQQIPFVTDSLLALSSLFSVLESLVEVFFPASSILAPMIAPMSATVNVSDKLFVRLTWRQTYPDVVFDTKNALQRLQIKAIYLEYGMDHKKDPLFKDALGLSLV